MKKRIIQKIVVFSLVLAMQAAPLSYAAEEGSEIPQENSVTLTENDGTKKDDSGDTENTGNQQTPDGSGNEEESGNTDEFENGEESGNTGEFENGTESGKDDGSGTGEGEESGETEDPETEVPAVPAEQGNPGWYLQGSDWYYYDANGAKAYGWRLIGGVWYYLDPGNTEKPGVMLASGKYGIDGSYFFFDGSGAMRTGWIKTAEGWYYASGSGAVVIGWQRIGGTWYYLDGANKEYPGVMLEDEKKVIGNATYFFASDGAMRTGWIKQEEGWYYSDTTSSIGWKYINGSWYYLDALDEEYPGRMAESCRRNIGGAIYFFSESGAMRSGWIKTEEGWYYASGSGAMVIGWQLIGGTWYYLDGANKEHPGLMAADCKMNIGGATYFFQQSGTMMTGWTKRPEGWYYTNGSGMMITGWIQYGDKWYYLDPANKKNPGLMVSDCTMSIGGHTYVFKVDGTMRAGWEKDADGNWYYYDTYTGQMKSGWQHIGSAWYYLDPDDGNKMLGKGWHTIGGAWYYMHGSGAMATNWLQVDGEWYYLGGDGAMKTGWHYIGNFWYYMYDNGVMARDTTIDGYYLQPNGAMMTAEQYNMYLRAQMYGSSTGYLILVDRAACRVGVFSGRSGSWNMVYFWACAPGTAATPTVGGEFTVQGKGYYFDSGSSRCYWYTQFYGNYLFHSVLYSKYNGSLVDGRVGIPLSHGCVRLEINNAKWIYDNIPRGTKVVIY